MQLLIGNRNYSSWSLRPWLFLRMSGVAFDTRRIPLYAEGSKAEILKYSPSGKVPLLIDGDLHVWDSLAICEYAIDRFSLSRAWPEDRAERAEARSIVAEMHSGFTALRSQLSMNCRRVPAVAKFDEAAAADIERIDAIWTTCRHRFSKRGPGLFGEWSLVDAFYAPVVLRFDRYRLPCSQLARDYQDNVLALPAMQEWIEAARLEKEILPQFEV
ncbi:MAG: glutathione S-transferase family protein [Pedobacter sp.]|nr:glutathione S-transferase family protein [Pedobacter sp.]